MDHRYAFASYESMRREEVFDLLVFRPHSASSLERVRKPKAQKAIHAALQQMQPATAAVIQDALETDDMRLSTSSLPSTSSPVPEGLCPSFICGANAKNCCVRLVFLCFCFCAYL
jgi:hypothetical protein